MIVIEPPQAVAGDHFANMRKREVLMAEPDRRPSPVMLEFLDRPPIDSDAGEGAGYRQGRQRAPRPDKGSLNVNIGSTRNHQPSRRPVQHNKDGDQVNATENKHRSSAMQTRPVTRADTRPRSQVIAQAVTQGDTRPDTQAVTQADTRPRTQMITISSFPTKTPDGHYRKFSNENSRWSRSKVFRRKLQMVTISSFPTKTPDGHYRKFSDGNSR
ncbi:hypothetical protein PoB_004991200 [Plakobranchus ocellatus]|uniref:Uncharacterized protein n=1 Tax=Plakobranchus ocellatus TaxID=259542 RepID=A0AAV4BW77_9GAST|nr:hypothetical protein PoB_004991200 [Plakobranchus ocellatus]